MQLVFDWPVNTAGYRWESASCVDASASAREKMLVPVNKRGPSVRYTPPPDLFLRFATMPLNEDGVAIKVFADEFGLLGFDDAARGERWADWNRAIVDMQRTFLTWHTSQKAARSNQLDSRGEAAIRFVAARLSEHLADVHETIRLRPDGRSLAIVVAPRNLLACLWHQLAEAIAVDKTARVCARQGCQNWIVVTPGQSTGKRRDRAYCSDACRRRAWHVAHELKSTTLPRRKQKR